MSAINWWPTAAGTRRHAVPSTSGGPGPGKALCGLTPTLPWAIRRAPLVEDPCRNCLRGRRPLAVVSSNVATIAHSATTLALDVTFQNGGHYRYFAVPRDIYQQLLTAASVGTALAQLVKAGGYRFTKYDPPEVRSA